MSISNIGLDSTIVRQLESAGIKSTVSSSSSYKDSTSSIYDLSSSGKKVPDAPDVSESELEQKTYLDLLEKYIRSYGAPKELERRGLKELEPLLKDEDEMEKIKKKANKNYDPNAIDTISETIQDPESENEIKVVVSKVDANGDMKITRIMSFGGQNSKEESSDKNAHGVNESDGKKSVFGEDREEHNDSVTKEQSADDVV